MISTVYRVPALTSLGGTKAKLPEFGMLSTLAQLGQLKILFSLCGVHSIRSTASSIAHVPPRLDSRLAQHGPATRSLVLQLPVDNGIDK